MENNINIMGKKIQKYIDILIISDFVVSTAGGFLKNSNKTVANYCFMIGGILLALAVGGIIYKYIKK